MKKLFSVITATVVIAAMGISCIACTGDGKKDGVVYEGTLSVATYESQEAAAEAFLTAELAGGNAKLEFVGYTKTGELSKSALKGLALGTVSAEDVTSAEEGTVEYRYAETGRVNLSAEPNTNHKQTIYVLGFEDVYRYYTPAVKTGEMLTKSYFDAVFDIENFTNVTMEQKTALKVTGDGMTMSMDADVTLQISATGVYMKVVQGFCESEITTDVMMELYGVLENGKLYVYTTNDGVNWNGTTTDYDGKTLLDDSFEYLFEGVREELFDGYDHTFFVRTEDGFALPEERYNEFARQYLEAADLYLPGDFNFTGAMNYTVKDNRLTKKTETVTVSYEAYKVEGSSVATYTNYGTTKVTVPSSVKEAVKTEE